MKKQWRKLKVFLKSMFVRKGKIEVSLEEEASKRIRDLSRKVGLTPLSFIQRSVAIHEIIANHVYLDRDAYLAIVWDSEEGYREVKINLQHPSDERDIYKLFGLERPQKKSRPVINLRLGTTEEKRVQEIQKLSGISEEKDLLFQSLQLFEYMVKQKGEGKDFFVKNEKGELESIEIFKGES